jgi:hypothetical protein
MSEQWPESELAAPEAESVDVSRSTQPDDDGSQFHAELVRAMQTTAALERIRIGEDSARRRQAQIEVVRARQASEADRMRELARDDMKAIESWAAGEIKRIKHERERRAKDLNEDLDLSIAEHSSKIDQEIDGIDAAIGSYLTEVDAFFDGLAEQTDPVQIARHAAKRPAFPALDAVAVAETDELPAPDQATAEVDAESPPADGEDGAADAAEPAVVGVMDSTAEAEPAESWGASPEASPEVVSAESSGAVEENAHAAEDAEPVTAAVASGHSGSGSLFESVSVMRPMSWLRRDGGNGDHSNHDG